jgi:hypothetical protein
VPSEAEWIRALRTIVRAVDANPNRLREIAQGGLAAYDTAPKDTAQVDRNDLSVACSALAVEVAVANHVDIPALAAALARLRAALDD